jgi:hypothetical protein
VVDSSYGVFAVCGSGGSEGEMWLIRVMVCLIPVEVVVVCGEMWLIRVMVFVLSVVVVVLRVRCG